MPSARRSRAIGLGAVLLALALFGIWRSGTPDLAKARVLPDQELSTQSSERAELEALAEIEIPENERGLPSPIATQPRDPQVKDLGAKEPIDRLATDTLKVRVINGSGIPVYQALVRATAMRTVKNPGDWYPWPRNAPQDKTDAMGIAELQHPVWRRSGGEWVAVSVVILAVEHPDYVTVSVEAPVQEDEVVVVLEHGAVLTVSAWIEDPNAWILDVDALLCYDVRVSSDDWVAGRDGRLSCNSIPPGKHIIALHHEREGVSFSSEGVEFELLEGEQKDLHLQLFPPRSLTGSLDPKVPRPVENGLVQIAVQSGSRENRAVLLQDHSSPVAADGTFRFEGLPPGDIEISGLCNGWFSIDLPPVEDLGNVRNQFVPADVDEDFVLHMQPTASLELTVLDPAGSPLKNAQVLVSPNVHWKVGFPGLIGPRPSTPALTDSRGIKLIENLPPREAQGVDVHHRDFRLPMGVSPWGRERRALWVDLVSGETTKVTVRLEENED